MFRSAWKALPGTLSVSTVLLVGVVAAWGALEAGVIGLGARPGSIVHAALHLAWLWASSLFEAALFRHALDRHDGTSRSLRELVWDPARAVRFAIAKLVFLVAFLPGLCLLVAPGILVAARLGWFAFALSDARTGPLEAIAKSLRATSGMTLRLMGLALTLLFVNLLGAALLGVGLLVTIPLTALVAAGMWRTLQPRAA